MEDSPSGPNRLSTVGHRGDVCFFKSLRHVAGLQAVYHFVDIAFEEAIEIIERKTDTMVGHAILRKIVSADFFLASATADQAFAMGGVFLLFLAPLVLEESGPHDLERALLVLLLSFGRPGNGRCVRSVYEGSAPRSLWY